MAAALKKNDHHHDEHHHHHHHRCDERCDEERLRELEKKIRKVAEVLEHLGRGEHMREMSRIICEPGWIKKAELEFVIAILERILFDVHTLERLQGELVDGCWKVGRKCR